MKLSNPISTVAMLLAVVILGLGTLRASQATDDYSALLAEASMSLDNFDSADWAFTETITTTEGIFIGKHDGRREEGDRWSLVSVDAREPTDEERDEYLSEKSNDNGDDEGSIADMVNPASLKLVDETDHHWQFEFTPIGDNDDDSGFLEHVNGELQISKDNVYISSIRLHSDEPFKPHFTVKIKEFLTHLQFGPVGHHLQIAPLQIEVRVKARALLVKGVEEESRITYSDYEFVGDLDGE